MAKLFAQSALEAKPVTEKVGETAMRVKFFALVAAMAASFSTASFAASALAPHCPTDPRASDVPELIYTYDGLTREGYESAIKALRETLPEWIEKRNKQDDQVFSGDIAIAYANFLNYVEGYSLKLEYLAADEDDRRIAEKRFCDFTSKEIIID